MSDDDQEHPGPFHPSIVYIDESGNHGPVSKDYPVFVLAFCIFEKAEYAHAVTTAIQEFKFRFFGHDTVVLHERDIRKQNPPFDFLHRPPIRERFYSELNRLIEEANFTLVAAAIRKDQFIGDENVYHVAMQFGLERVYLELGLEKSSPRLHLVCESRGRREDDELELAFRRICDGDNFRNVRMPCDLVFAGKERCHAGMELADLVARPIGRHVLKPEQPNRAWDLLRPKFRRRPGGEIEGWGLKIFPR